MTPVRKVLVTGSGGLIAGALVRDYLAWEVVVNDSVSILRAIELERRYRLAFWDALVVQAANSAAVEVLYSEDLSHGQVYDAVELVNPFLSPESS